MRKWSLIAAPLALLAGQALAQSPPPAIPVPPVGTAPPPSQPVSAVAAPMPKPTPLPAMPPSVAQGGPAAAPPGMPAPAAPVAAASVPGAPRPPGAPIPPMPGMPGIPALPSVLATPEARPVRTLGENEVEIPRAEYKGRLLACISYSGQCKLSGLTPQDRDYIRYELRGKRYDPAVTADIVQMRMYQFTNETSPDVIVPKLPENTPGAPIRRVTTIENRSDVEGYGLAVTIPHADSRSGGLERAPNKRGRPAGLTQAPDWW